MAWLSHESLVKSIGDTGPDSIHICPLLESDQIGSVSIDLRLGYDFLVSIVTKQPSISIARRRRREALGISSFFQETRRDIGQRFVVYPNQVVVATSLEYVCLPLNLLADVYPRSSISKLGISFGVSLQPGYRGCVPLEMSNHGNTPVELVVGSRIAQIRFGTTDAPADARKYAESGRHRKYYGMVRPTPSRAGFDAELDQLATAGKFFQET